MGLDMTMYKNASGRDEIKAKHQEVVKASNKYVDDLLKSEPTIEEKVKAFIEDKKALLSKDDTQYTLDSTLYKVKSILYGNDKPSVVKWDLFNNCTRFDMDITDRDKARITMELLEILAEYKTSDEQVNRLKEEEDLANELEATQVEIAYWRKYHALNDFILNKFGGDNCEETVLSMKAMQDIKMFIQDDGEDTKQVDSILDSWDETATYVYYPWW